MNLSFWNLFVLYCILPISVFSKLANYEDKFVEHFKNSSNNYVRWNDAHKWDDEDNRMRMHKVCNEAHRIYAKGSFFIEWVSFTENVTLVFEDPKYPPMIIDIIEYRSRQDENIPADVKEYLRTNPIENWYLTIGRREDCVHYLMSVQKKPTRHFQIVEEVCGLAW